MKNFERRSAATAKTDARTCWKLDQLTKSTLARSFLAVCGGMPRHNADCPLGRSEPRCLCGVGLMLRLMGGSFWHSRLI